MESGGDKRGCVGDRPCAIAPMKPGGVAKADGGEVQDMGEEAVR